MSSDIAKLAWVCCVGMTVGTDVRAEVRLASIFNDHMVLQHGLANRIWGWAEPGEAVTATLGGQSATRRANASGQWDIQLPAMSVSRQGRPLRVRGADGSEAVIQDVLVGEVWLATGPSNIHWAVEKCDNAKQEIANAHYPQIRFFTVARAATDEPQQDCDGRWIVCGPKTVGPVSGVAYFFSRRIHKELDVPVGVLQSFWGGSRVEAWTSVAGLKTSRDLLPILDWWHEARTSYDPRAPKPKAAINPLTSHHRPGSLYNGMIAPLVGYGIRGMITYQGLGNLFWAERSKPLMRAMVRDWRGRWGQGDFPFGMVQPAPFPTGSWAKQRDDAYQLQRESQLWLMHNEPNIGIALTTDIGDVNQLHFTNKQAVGWRMASWALTEVYGRPDPYLGPLCEWAVPEKNTMRVSFKHAEGLRTRDGQPPSHFELAGADGEFHIAEARIRGRTVIVKSQRVKKPVAVRMGWSDAAEPNLENADGLPVSPFRVNAD
ncbi:MAG: sialate O-acetylesterase [Planctomycetota bacterium]|jgi:sialate O-acetylesterase